MSPPSLLLFPRERKGRLLSADPFAFTLVELLVVMGVIVIILAVAVPAVTALKGAGDVNKTVYDLAGILEQSRAYAMSNNTYVYVGLAELDASQSTGATPQTAGAGRLALAVVASRDGTQGVSTTSLQNGPDWKTVYPAFAANLTVIGKPLVFDNVHVPDPDQNGVLPATGNMTRPTLTGTECNLGSTKCVSATRFDYPVSPTGSNLGRGQYSFTKVIQFDPQGVARIQSASNPSAIIPYLEIGLQQTHGTAYSSPPAGNVAALQIDGMTGVTHIYRP